MMQIHVEIIANLMTVAFVAANRNSCITIHVKKP
jgi:hypothetical protein